MNLKLDKGNILLLAIIGLAAILIINPTSRTFTLAVFPLILVFIGIIFLKQSGATMAVVGWLTAIALVIIYFHTAIEVALGASLYGIIKSFGITISVLGTILMIFLMKEAGALTVISSAVKRIAKTKEEQAIFIGIGFGTLVTSLGVVTPSLFPPFLMALGFGAAAAVSISVLGYNATTSFALLSIPVILPAGLFGFDPKLFAYKICLYLPIIATLISFAMLYMVGGKDSVKKGWFSAVVSGLSIGIYSIVFVVIGVPILIVGVLTGGFTMILFYIFCRKKEEKTAEKMNWNDLLRALSPWIILITFALIISVPQISSFLKDIDGPAFSIYGTAVDFDVFTQIYTWIFLATFISIPIMKFNRGAIKKTTILWSKRILQPFLAYSLFFAIAYIMAWSACPLVGGTVVTKSANMAVDAKDIYNSFNMNVAVASTLAGIFGGTFIYVAAWLGLFGAVVGGSEASSNVMFYPIQKNIAGKIGLTDDQFMTMYAAHANGGGVASAITPSKINNAVVTINEKSELESAIMKKHLPIVIAITIVIGLMNALFVMWSI